MSVADQSTTTRLTAPAEELKQAAQRVKERYSNGEDRPLGGYLEAMAAYSAAVGALSLVVRRKHRPLPSLSGFDLVVMGAATHRLSRLLSKDSVTSPLRAPFATYEGVEGPSKLKESVHGEGTRHAIGELLTCPYCLGQWVATGFLFGHILAPKASRLAAGLFSALTISDVLHSVTARLETEARKS